MLFKKKDKALKKSDSEKKSPALKNLSMTKEIVPSETNKKPLVDTSFVFFEDK